MMDSMSPTEKVETAAEAMFVNRFGDHKGPWSRFKYQHSDIADIYRDNARVALSAIGAIPKE